MNRWWNLLRSVIIVWLGVFLIVFAAVTHDNDIQLLLTGLALLGLIPADRIFRRRDPPPDKDDEEAE